MVSDPVKADMNRSLIMISKDMAASDPIKNITYQVDSDRVADAVVIAFTSSAVIIVIRVGRSPPSKPEAMESVANFLFIDIIKNNVARCFFIITWPVIFSLC
ncbi:hypothetical protein Bpla01_37820 [Burkholderia plantarii]|nr:hypothetical protein Bpla01_37820 [Burkholderia plantarii]